MKHAWIFALLVCPVIGRADLVLERADNTRAVVYADQGRIWYEGCQAGAKPARGCSGQDRSQIFSVEADRFARSVQSFYGLVDPLYGGVNGGRVLAEKMNGLQQHLDHDEFTADELHNAETVMLGFVRLNEKFERAQRELLQYLAAGNDLSLNSEYQGQRYNVLNLSFYPIVYFADRHKIYRMTEAVTFDRVAGLCATFSKEWSQFTNASSIGRDLRSRLAGSPLVTPGQVTRLWTSGQTSGMWKITCDNSYQGSERYYNFPPVVRMYSPEELRRKEREASMSASGSLCKYTANGVEVGREYIPGVSTVVDLGGATDLADQSEAVEAGEGSFTGTAHPVLCEKDYEFKTGDSDDGYLNGEHFADFSIYHLERSLELMAKSVYSNRAEFFRAVAKALGEFPLHDSDDIKLGFHTAGARLFVLMAIEPLLHDIQSKFVDNYVLPDYNRAKEQWSKRLGAEALGDIDMSAPTYRLALSLLSYGLKASQAYLNTDDKQAVEALLPALGKAMAAGPKGLADLSPALQKARPLFDRLTEARRVHGFGVMGTAVAEYLIKKGGGR